MAQLNKYGEIEESACPKCGKPIKPEWVTCPACGARLSQDATACSQCGLPLKSEWKACPECGGLINAIVSSRRLKAKKLNLVHAQKMDKKPSADLNQFN